MKSTPITRPLISWALYDFANTLFSAVVLTSLFPLYFTKLAGSNWLLGAATTGSMILSGFVIPMLGALSDQTGKTKTYLIKATLLCVLFLTCLSFSKNILFLTVTFGLACFFYHASLVFYNSLLPVVADPEKQGFASGLGVGLGYLGVVIGLPIASWMGRLWGEPWVFAGTAFLFLLFSLPAFLFVPERSVENPLLFRWSLWRTEHQKLLAFVREISRDIKLLGFFAGNFFIVDALNAMILWFSVFAREVFHPSQNEILTLLIGINFSAFVMGLFSGVLTDRWGACRTFLLSAGVLILTLISLTLAPDFKTFALAGLLGGAFAIAGIWTAGRKALLELAPKDKVGEYFGLYGLTTKISVIGNFAFGVVADMAGFQPALRVLLFPASAGFIFLGLSVWLSKREP